MKKTILFLLSILIFSCSKNEENIETKTTLKIYSEPFFKYEALKSEVTSRYGETYETEPNNFSLGYKMVYEAKEDGVLKYYFSLDNQETLWETEVLLYSGKENVDFLKSFLSNKYTFDSEISNSGLVVIRYNNSTTRVALSYLEGTYTGITISYKSI